METLIELTSALFRKHLPQKPAPFAITSASSPSHQFGVRRSQFPPSGRRHVLVEQLAYTLAERRNFSPGGELPDWLQAEAEVNIWFDGEHFSGD